MQDDRRQGADAAGAAPGQGEEARWEIIAIVGWAEAEVIRGKLESAGIPCLLQRESAGTAFVLTVGALGEVKVLVPERLARQALDLVSVDESEQEDRAEADGD